MEESSELRVVVAAGVIVVSSDLLIGWKRNCVAPEGFLIWTIQKVNQSRQERRKEGKKERKKARKKERMNW
jgi:hypothetical protein